MRYIDRSGNGISVELSESISAEITSINAVCIGSFNEGSGSVRMRSGYMEAEFHGKRIACIGSYKGNVSCNIKSSLFTIHCEGGYSTCIGDYYGGDVDVVETRVDYTALAQDGYGIVFANGRINTAHSCTDIKINP